MGRMFGHLRLLKNLQIARKAHDNKDEREGLKLALGAVAHYLDDAGADPRIKMMFLRLRLALEELDYGVTHSLLVAQKIGHRPRESMEKFIGKAYASAIMELLMKAGSTKGDAASRVARAVKAWPIFEGLQVTARTVINWRDAVKAKLTAESRDKSYFEFLVENGFGPQRGASRSGQDAYRRRYPVRPP